VRHVRENHGVCSDVGLGCIISYPSRVVNLKLHNVAAVSVIAFQSVSVIAECGAIFLMDSIKYRISLSTSESRIESPGWFTSFKTPLFAVAW
jgi:hypothetical protein